MIGKEISGDNLVDYIDNSDIAAGFSLEVRGEEMYA